MYGLGAVKGLGEGAIQNLVEERDKAGAFDDLLICAEESTLVASTSAHWRPLLERARLTH